MNLSKWKFVQQTAWWSESVIKDDKVRRETWCVEATSNESSIEKQLFRFPSSGFHSLIWLLGQLVKAVKISDVLYGSALLPSWGKTVLNSTVLNITLLYETIPFLHDNFHIILWIYCVTFGYSWSLTGWWVFFPVMSTCGEEKVYP